MKGKMDAILCLKSRRSIRDFESDPIPLDMLLEILECGRWAPSGLNHQPWKIYVIRDSQLKNRLSTCTECAEIIQKAPCVFAIFLDQTETYNYTKNVQSIGALFENLLLAIHALGLGGVWLGQIYNNKEDVHGILEIKDSKLEFMGCIAFGYPKINDDEDLPERKELNEFVVYK